MSYLWSVPSGGFIQSGQGTAIAKIGAYSYASSGTINVSANPVCGVRIFEDKYVTIGTGGAQLRTYDENGNETFDELDSSQEEVSVSVYNLATGQKVAVFECITINSLPDLSSVPSGMYILQYQIDGTEKTTKIIKQ